MIIGGMQLGKLQNAAYDIFVREYGVGDTAEYSKYEDVIKRLDKLGNDLLGIGPPFPTSTSRNKMLETHIGLVISALIELANQHNLDMRRYTV
jgi:hypothetical protein